MSFFNGLKEALYNQEKIFFNTIDNFSSNSKIDKSFFNKNDFSLKKPKEDFINDYKICENTRVFFVVNRYNELIQTSSRIFYSSSQKPKPIYLTFLSKEDAIDFLYKIASEEPKAFKKAGLGINSFPIKKYSNLLKKANHSSYDLVLINNLSEMEFLLSNSKSFKKDFVFLNKNTLKKIEPFDGNFAYSMLFSKVENSSFSKKLYFTLEDLENDFKIVKESVGFRLGKSKVFIKVHFLSPSDIKNFF